MMALFVKSLEAMHSRALAAFRLFSGAALIAAMLLFHSASAYGADFSQLTKDIQQALAEYGYRPGPADGLFGKRTKQSIEQFQREYRLAITGEADIETAVQLGIRQYAPLYSAEIIVVTDSAKKVSAEISKRDHAAVLNYLLELRDRSKNKIDMVFERPKTVVFVVDEDLEVDDVVVTQIEVIRRDNPKWVENFYYEIAEDTPTEPLLIINQAEAGWELQLTHRAILNGKVIGLKRTRAAP